MKSLKDTKIKKSLLMGYAITIVVSIALIVVCIVMLFVQKNQYENLIDEEASANQEILYARMYYILNGRTVREVFLSPDNPDNDTMMDTAQSYMDMGDEHIALLQEVYPDGLDRTLLDEYVKSVETWQAVRMVPDYEQYKATGNKAHINNGINTIMNQDISLQADMAEAADALDNFLVDSMTDARANINRMIMITMVVLVIALIVATAIVLKLAFAIINSITHPTEEVHKALVGFSEGNFDIKVEFEGTNELGEMCDAMRTSQYILKNAVDDINNVLGEMANSNFNIRTKDETLYVGGLQPVLTAMRNINANLSDVLSQISSSADQVSSGADQVSSGAQGLSQGATEQASSVEELASTITDISDQIKRNADNAQQATEISKQVGEEIMRSNEQMEKMTAAMGEINDKSTQIAKIIKTIEDIAFQTNILALNAAVEAARAGVAGKGFAVVADEVRNLATKSAEASKNTSALIESTVTAVENGNRIATETAEALLGVVEGAKNVVSTIDKIAEASKQQSAAVEQVTLGVDQISSVVQTNSATAEESAAASEELSAQANVLNDLVGQFTLSEEYTGKKSGIHRGVEEEPIDYDFGSDKY